jgi:hypothetical protein
MRSQHIIDANQCIFQSVISISYPECMIVCQIRVCYGQVRLTGLGYAVPHPLGAREGDVMDTHY